MCGCEGRGIRCVGVRGGMLCMVMPLEKEVGA